jgi:hypothetical protein
MMWTWRLPAQKPIPEQEAPRESARSPPIVMTYHKPHSTPKRLKTCQREYELRNTRNGTCILTKEMVDYSAMISNLFYCYKYFTFSPNSENSIKDVLRHLPPDMQAEDISNSIWT